MQRYMNSMSSGGTLIGSMESPLANEALAAVIPSLFAVDAHESRSDRFVPIATIDVLESLRAADFVPVFAQQAKTRIAGKELFTRHMLRLRHRSLVSAADEAFEIILVNANDGTASYKMIAGIFRFVCLNGLMTGDTFGTTTVRHAGKHVVSDVRDGALAILNRAPEVLEQVARFKGITLNRDEAMILADAAHRVRFANAYEQPTDSDGNEIADVLPVFNETKAPVSPLDLLRTRRVSDRTPTLWSAYNIAQENCEKGGQRGYIVGTKGQVRKARVREVKGIAQKTALNQALWAITTHMAETKEA